MKLETKQERIKFCEEMLKHAETRREKALKMGHGKREELWYADMLKWQMRLIHLAA